MRKHTIKYGHMKLLDNVRVRKADVYACYRHFKLLIHLLINFKNIEEASLPNCTMPEEASRKQIHVCGLQYFMDTVRSVATANICSCFVLSTLSLNLNNHVI